METLLRMTDITKRYGNGILANDKASFEVRAGEIHAIAGENGAGKSTLMKILCGAIGPDGGEIIYSGQKVNISSPKAAAAMGIGMVYQHFMLVDELPVWQNVFLGIERKKGMFMDIPGMIAETDILCRRYAMPMDVRALCGKLPVGVRQKVEILKVLARGAKLIVLDEPTAVLTPQETEQLFAQLRLLRDGGHTIVIITHKLKEIKALCDRVTIMRGGKTMGVHDVADVSEQQISELMVGGSVRLKVERLPPCPVRPWRNLPQSHCPERAESPFSTMCLLPCGQGRSSVLPVWKAMVSRRSWISSRAQRADTAGASRSRAGKSPAGPCARSVKWDFPTSRKTA